VVLSGSARSEGTQLSLDAPNVTLPELAKRLTEALGCEVRIEGLATGTVSITLKEVSPANLLSETATALGSRWQTIYRFSTQEPAAAAPVSSGVQLKLDMPNVSCQAASSVVTRMAGARVERDGDLKGQVALVGAAMPVEEAMDAIARAAGATWRRIYVIQVDALPQTITARTAETPPDKSTDKTPEKPKGPKAWSNHVSLTGKPPSSGKRDRFDTKKAAYAKGIRPPQPTLEQIEKHAMLGMYGNFFLYDSDSGRESAMKSFQAGLDLQLRRLEALPANQRMVTTMMTRRNFERLIDDFANLDKEQKKLAQPLYDYAKDRLSRPPLKP
jgi:hypothetical protein